MKTNKRYYEKKKEKLNPKSVVWYDLGIQEGKKFIKLKTQKRELRLLEIEQGKLWII